MPLYNPFLLTTLFAIGSLSMIISAAPAYNANYCPNNATYDSNNIFQTNLKVLLYSLTTNATAGTDTYQTFMGLGKTVNVASGLFLCRADVSSATCRDCVATAASEITRRCPNKTESIIWYDECMLWYTNRYFNSDSVVPGASLPGDKNISASDLDSFNRTLFGLLDGLAEETANSQSAKKFAAGEAAFGRSSSSRVYAMTQCVPLMTTTQCESCLQKAIGTLPACCGGRQGARALLSWCNVRYELYQFYNTSGTSTPSSGNFLNCSVNYA